MKVALLSFHNAYNYGAALQAYGLQCAVEELGASCEYINYVNRHRRASYDMKSVFIGEIRKKNYPRAIKALVGAPLIKKRGKRFNEFYRQYLKVTKKIYTSSKEAEELNDEYDRFIVGSDQVWNIENNGGDIAFLLDFVKKKEKKLSYSSSFGMSEVPGDFEDAYRNSLADLGRIAVREKAGVNIVKKLTGRDAHLVVDPVFLPGVKKWNELRRTNSHTNQKYVFFYTNNNAQVSDFISTGYSMKGKTSHILSTHVSIKDFLNPTKKIKVSMSIEDFLNDIANAEIVVTASFHCLAFAIIFHKPFCVILTGNRGKDERLLNLLNICGLESRIITSKTTVKDINKTIDYDLVDKKLNHYIEYSKKYLNNAIWGKPDVNMETKVDDNRYYCDDERCYGCTACACICPVNAIHMEPDLEGFMKPVRDEEKCIDCYKCHKVCQVYDNYLYKPTSRFYAAKNKNEIRIKSTSGGVFTAISDVVLNAGGIICAATLDDDYYVSHSFAKNINERDKMRKTCYVQSNLKDVYLRVKCYLEESRKVLFVGTPCQVKGLRMYLGKKMDDLYTCDIICHGVPSPDVFKMFINNLRKRGKLEKFEFRNKKLGWKNTYTVTATIEKNKYSNNLWLQSFIKMFSHNMINRQSCSNCMYANYSRVGDITIGDFWGIEKEFPEFKDSLGVSLVICNNDKGENLLKKTKDLEIIEVGKECTIQNSLLKPSMPSPYRNQIFRNLYKYDYQTVAKKFGEDNWKGWIKNQIRKKIR